MWSPVELPNSYDIPWNFLLLGAHISLYIRYSLWEHNSEACLWEHHSEVWHSNYRALINRKINGKAALLQITVSSSTADYPDSNNITAALNTEKIQSSVVKCDFYHSTRTFVLNCKCMFNLTINSMRLYGGSNYVIH